MALTERSRSALYLGLSDLIEEQAVQEMLSYFPARDVEEPVTKDFLRAEMADLRAEMADLRADMADLRAEMADFRTEMRTDMADLRSEMERNLRSFQAWTVGTGISLGGLVIATNAVFG
jgi:hypothetical protein